MEEELQRPSTTEVEAPKESSRIKEASPKQKVVPPPLPSQAQRHRKQLSASQQTNRAVARITPSNPLELPTIHEDTIYACVTSEALKAAGKEAAFRVPSGFVALLSDPDGRFRSTLLSGEEARGSFLLHLFRQGTHNLPQHIRGLHSKDGFDLSADISFSCRFPDGEASAMQDFIFAHVLGRTHFSGALLKSDLQKEARRAIADIASEMDAADLIQDSRRDSFEPPFILAMRKRLAASGIEVRGLDSLVFASKDLQDKRRSEARQERRVQESQKREEVRAVIAREKIGAELSRQELSEVLDSLRQKKEINEIAHEKDRIERKNAVEALEREYRAEQYNLESALKKMLAKNELEIDRLKFEEYLRMTSEVRDRLQEDRIEFYISQIQDEALKSRLLLRLIERDMTPEQLSELAELERARAEANASENEDKENSSESEEEAPSASPEPMAGFQLAFSPEAPTNLAIAESARHATTPIAPSAPVSSYEQLSDALPPTASVTPQRQVTPPPLPTQAPVAPQTQLHQAHGNQEKLSFLATAGRRLVAVDIAGQASSQRLLADFTSEPLGSLRSLNVESVGAARYVFAGARRGVYRYSLDGGNLSLFPIDSGIAPQTGVNSTLVHAGSLYATHSQFGLLRWGLNAENYPATRVAKQYTDHSQTVRSLFLDEGNWPTFACGNRIIAIEHGVHSKVVAVYQGAPSEILLAISHENRFFAACRSGEIVYWEKTNPKQAFKLSHLGHKLFGATLSADGKSMVLVSRDTTVRMLDVQNGVLSRYDAPTEIVLGSDFGSTLAGVSRDRASVFLWDSFGNGQPYVEIYLSEPTYDICTL